MQSSPNKMCSCDAACSFHVCFTEAEISREVQEEAAGKAVLRGGRVLPPGTLRGTQVQQGGHPMAACQARPLHHTMEAHPPPTAALVTSQAPLSSAIDLLHQAMHMQVSARSPSCYRMSTCYHLLGAP